MTKDQLLAEIRELDSRIEDAKEEIGRYGASEEHENRYRGMLDAYMSIRSRLLVIVRDGAYAFR